MPTYTFRNKETGEEWDDIVSMAERERILNENPHYETLIKPIGVRDNFISGTGIKPSDEFKSILKQIKKHAPGSNMDTF